MSSAIQSPKKQHPAKAKLSRLLASDGITSRALAILDACSSDDDDSAADRGGDEPEGGPSREFEGGPSKSNRERDEHRGPKSQPTNFADHVRVRNDPKPGNASQFAGCAYAERFMELASEDLEAPPEINPTEALFSRISEAAAESPSRYTQFAGPTDFVVREPTYPVGTAKLWESNAQFSQSMIRHSDTAKDIGRAKATQSSVTELRYSSDGKSTRKSKSRPPQKYPRIEQNAPPSKTEKKAPKKTTDWQAKIAELDELSRKLKKGKSPPEPSSRERPSKIAGSAVSAIEWAPPPERKVPSSAALFERCAERDDPAVVPRDLRSRHGDVLQSFLRTPFDERTMKALHRFKESNERNAAKVRYAEKLPVLSQKEFLRRKRDGLVDEMERDWVGQIEGLLGGGGSDGE